MPGPRPQPAAAQRQQRSSENLAALYRCSRPSVPVGKFYPAFLHGICNALRAPSAFIWRLNNGEIQVIAHRNHEQSGLRTDTEEWSTHLSLLAGVVRDAKPVRLHPGEVTPVGTNPLKMELFCVPIAGPQGAQFVIEVVCPILDGEQKKGRLARLIQVCVFFQDYMQSQELLMKAERVDAEAGLRAYLSRLNAVSTSQELAVVAVNEGRQLIGCERVCLGWLQGRTPQILSVSGLATIDPRSNVVRALSMLTTSATRCGQVLQTSLPLPAVDSKDGSPPSVPDAYRVALDAYMQTEHPSQLLVIPVGETRDAGRPRGALIIEQFQSGELPRFAAQRASFIAEQVGLTLGRVELLESIPSWWTRSAQIRWPRRLGRWLMGFLVLAAVAGLATVPMELRLPAEGELMAETRHCLFAPETGVIREVHVEHGSRVSAGDPLVTLDNIELKSQLQGLTGQLIQLRERQRSLEARRSGRLAEREQIELQSGLIELASSVEHTEHQIKLMRERLDRLRIVAPADGIVTSWNVKQSLLNRTVLAGDSLLQEIDPEGPWLIELRIPEDRIGYIIRYRAGMPNETKVRVEYVLATEPERRYSGLLRSIGPRTELTADGHIVRAVIELDPESLPPLRDGAEVKARLHCGNQIAGFVWFRELIEVIQTYWWY
ncbi:MAG: HlyD family efflux transporter periplasmic adaptor subunit [Planctomycetes bacterium]|nr:HlyD family efflux transporter periplasmic adaptor subunit [Planctomycetota bacterium]